MQNLKSMIWWLFKAAFWVVGALVAMNLAEEHGRWFWLFTVLGYIAWSIDKRLDAIESRIMSAHEGINAVRFPSSRY
jgi:hypothetical protein